MRGASVEEVVEALVVEGLPEALSEREAKRLANQPAVHAVRRTLRPQRTAVSLRRSQLRRVAGPLEARPADAICWATQLGGQMPVRVGGLTDHWPIYAQGIDGLVDHFGAVEVEVRTWDDSGEGRKMVRETWTVADFAGAVREVEGDQRYLTAQERVIEGPLRGLMDWLAPIPGVVEEVMAERLHLWLGGKGVVSPLHRDPTDNLLVQIEGSKRVWLAPPEETEIDDFAPGRSSTLDLADADGLAELGLDEMAIFTCELQPGEALWIPAGWWHQVVGLSPSMAITCSESLGRPDLAQELATQVLR